MKTVDPVVLVHGYDHDPDSVTASATRIGGVYSKWAGQLPSDDFRKYPFEWYSGRMFRDTFKAWSRRYRTSYGWAYSELAPAAGERLARIGFLRGADVICHSLGSLAVLHALSVRPNFFRRVLFLNGAATVDDAVPIIRKNQDVNFMNVWVETDDILSTLGAWFEPRIGKHDCIGQVGLQGHGLHHVIDVQLDDYATQSQFLEKGYDLHGDNPEKVSDHLFSYLHGGNWKLYRDFLKLGRAAG